MISSRIVSKVLEDFILGWSRQKDFLISKEMKESGQGAYRCMNVSSWPLVMGFP